MTEGEIVRPLPQQTERATSWSPIAGPETTRYLHNKPEGMRARLLTEGLRVFGRCGEPGAQSGRANTRAGLILGYVQSGKTSSFTTLTALARDNGFQLVIIIAGISRLLQRQTTTRLVLDLGLDQMDAFRRWSLLENPSVSSGPGATLRNLLAQHADPGADHFDLGVPLVVVMKQHVQLGKLIALLDDIPDLDRINALVIDDEAHMHSPNVAAEGEESATYGKLKRLRGCLPLHTLLQYTATPQAPLLAHIADELSPDFICLLDAGYGYTGGEYFFVDHHEAFVELIPDDELYALDADEFRDQGPPASLRRAFVTYLLACAASRERRELEPTHNSMLVHPHSRTDVHRVWMDSIESMRQDISRLLDAPEADEDRREFVNAELGSAWEELRDSDELLPELSVLVPHVKTVLQRLQIQSVNSQGSANVPWPNAPYWILVGGNLLGVGFTVEGLRVTHMMRGGGVRLADTIQQRARFFGYKAAYARSCRSWLQGEVDAALVDYVRHEKALRASLADFDRENKPLKEWKRAFLLDPSFRLTRQAAQRISLDQFRLDGEGWCLQQLYLEDELDLLFQNRADVESFVRGLSFTRAQEISGDTPATAHEIAPCSLSDLRALLARIGLSSSDSRKFTALSLLLAAATDHGEAERFDQCAVVKIAAGMQPRRRQRAVEWTGERIGKVTLHQGRNPREGEPRYPGDSKARDERRITLQVHQLDLRQRPNGPLIEGAVDLPFLGVCMPPELRTGVVREV